jgi:hypothetical protein
MDFPGAWVIHRALRWLRGPSLIDQMIQAEIEGPQVRDEDPELEARILAAEHRPSRMTVEEVQQARRIRAMLTYGTEDEDPEEVALLTEEERERLEPIAIQRRWARIWSAQRR